MQIKHIDGTQAVKVTSSNMKISTSTFLKAKLQIETFLIWPVRAKFVLEGAKHTLGKE